MIMRSYTAWLIPAAVMVFGFGPGAARATAQTITYPFDATYETVLDLRPVTSDVDLAVSTGVSTNAPYGLTNLISSAYSRFDPTTNVTTFSADPTQFGLQGFPFGSDTYFGSGPNKLFGNTSSATATFDFVNGTVTGSGTLNITDGEGIFTDATGTLTFTQNDALNPDPTAPIVGEAILSGSIEAVPEPVSWPGMLVGIGVLGSGILLRQRRRHSSTSG